jgi:hypothetical protein
MEKSFLNNLNIKEFLVKNINCYHQEMRANHSDEWQLMTQDSNGRYFTYQY